MRDSWTEVTLGDIAEYVNGFPFKPEDLGEEGTPVIRIKQLLDPTETCDRTLVNVPDRCVLQAGDIVFSWSGTLAVRVWDRGRAYLNQHLFRVVEKDGVMHEWLPLVLDHAIQDLSEMTHGTTMKHVTKQTLLPHPILLPPLSEQKRIVDVLASVDAYIAALQQQASDARTARNAVLHELLTAAGDDWTETNLGSISSFITARMTAKSVGLAVPYVGLEHVDPHSSTISRWGRIATITSSVTPFDPGDVLFGRLRPYLHKVALAEFAGVCSPELLVLRAAQNCESRFLHLLCSAETTINACVEMSAGTRMPRTSTRDLASIQVVLPPLLVQRRIAELVAVMDYVILSTENAVTDALRLRFGLLSSLLTGDHEIPATYDRLLGAA